MSAKEAFTLAKELLLRDGWQQQFAGPDIASIHAPRCSAGALYAACRSTDDPYHEIWLRLNHALSPDADTNAIRWNDEPGRTVDEVLALFDKAISEADEILP